LNYNVSVNSSNGPIRFNVPVEISGGQPIMPTNFKYSESSYSFSKSGFEKISRITKKASSDILKVSEDTANMSYNELIGMMITASNNGDLRGAEDALMQIQASYSGQSVINAINKYSSLLKHNSKNEERERFIKEALRSGELIRTSTSFDLYSPKYGKYLSSLAFDVTGKLIPKYRFKNENLKESESLNITTSQIKLT